MNANFVKLFSAIETLRSNELISYENLTWFT